MEINPFEFVKAISENKHEFSREELEANYNPFLTNRQLSYFADCIHYVNDLNMYPNLFKDMQFSYLNNTIRHKKRYSKWAKSDELEEINTVCEMFGCNPNVAKTIMKNIPKEEIIKYKKEKDNDN